MDQVGHVGLRAVPRVMARTNAAFVRTYITRVRQHAGRQKDGVREQVDNLSANEPSLDQTIEFQKAKSRL